MLRRSATVVARPAASVLIRELGRGGSSSRMIRRSSSYGRHSADGPVKRRGAGQQFVEQHTQRVDVAASIDIQRAELGLFRAHVERRADHLDKDVWCSVFSVSSLADGFGHTKVDDLRRQAGHRAWRTRTLDGLRSR